MIETSCCVDNAKNNEKMDSGMLDESPAERLYDKKVLEVTSCIGEASATLSRLEKRLIPVLDISPEKTDEGCAEPQFTSEFDNFVRDTICSIKDIDRRMQSMIDRLGI